MIWSCAETGRLGEFGGFFGLCDSTHPEFFEFGVFATDSESTTPTAKSIWTMVIIIFYDALIKTVLFPFEP